MAPPLRRRSSERLRRARRGLRLMQGVAISLRQQLHILQKNWFSDRTDDFLAGYAVVVSSLLPPFAKTIKCKSRVMLFSKNNRVMQFKDTLGKSKVINMSHRETWWVY